MNKTTNLILTCICMLTLSFTSCSSDDDSNENNNPTRALQVEKLDGSVFQDGDIVTFNEVGTDDIRSDQGKLKYNLRNVSSQNINVKVEVMAIRGTDGSMFTFCIQPLCIFDVVVGGIYPGSGTIIEPGEVNSNDDYFINRDMGDGATSIEYDFRFFVEDENGNQTDDLNITYKYEPAI